MAFSVRFIKDFTLTILRVNEGDELTLSRETKEVSRGDIHLLERRNVHPENVDLFFAEADAFGKCVALAVPKDHCEFLLPSKEQQIAPKRKSGGCGGCGG